MFGLLGPNGAGKTTTILMLLGLTEPTAGTAWVDGINPTRDPLRVKSQVGYVPDNVGFYEDLTARGNLRYTAQLNRVPRTADGRADRPPARGRRARRRRRPPRSAGYSRGMRQRLGLADALVKDPSILVLDEPTVNIDPEGVRELLLLVERLRTDQGMTVLLSSHLLHQVEQVCDRIGIFVKGRLVAVGTVDELAGGSRRPRRARRSASPSSTTRASRARRPRGHEHHPRRGTLVGRGRSRRPGRAGDRHRRRRRSASTT